MEPVVHDYLIIGAGPAGLQMDHHLARAWSDTWKTSPAAIACRSVLAAQAIS